MKGFLKKIAALALAAALCVCSFTVPDVKISAEEVSSETNLSGENFLKEISGEYVPLFEGGIFNSEYDHYWHDYTAAIVGESMADMCVAMMKKAIGASTYGEQAGEDFFCGYTEDVVKIAFAGKDGTKVTFTKKDGKKITHNYAFEKPASATGIVENADGYEIVYSTNSNFKKAKTKTITSKNSGKTKKLKSNTYYVKVRAFSTDYAGNKVYGEFSDVKTIIIE